MALKSYFITASSTGKDFLEKINRTKHKALFVVDEHNALIGTATEGDFRRFFLTHNQAGATVSDFFNRNPISIYENDRSYHDILKYDLTKGAIPVLNSHDEVIDVYDPKKQKSYWSRNLEKSFIAIAPTRISFAGGGSDLSRWFKSEAGLTVNLGIKKYARVHFSTNQDHTISIHSENTGEELLIPVESLMTYKDKKLKIVISVLQKMRISEGLNIKIYCDFEPGTGLGGSSSLTVALIKGLTHLNNHHISAYDMFKLAYECERIDCGIIGGWQDFIPSTFGGLCITHYNKENINVLKLDLDATTLEQTLSNLFMVRVGKIRSSSDVHEKIQKESDTDKYYHTMKQVVSLAEKVVLILGGAETRDLGKILNEGWQAKKEISPHISNPLLDERYEFLLRSGATGGRLLGAGGSGYFLMYVPQSEQPSFCRKLRQVGMDFERIERDTHGARIIEDPLR